MNVASFVLNVFEDVVEVVMHCGLSVEPFFCSQGEEFVVVIEVYGTWFNGTETSVVPEFVCDGCCSIIDKFCER